MARTRSRARTAPKAAEEPVAPPAEVQEPVQAVVSDDEQPLEAEAESADDAPAISLSHEDFEGNPAVIDMAKVVDGGGSDDGEDAADEPAPKARGRVRVRLNGIKNPRRPTRPFPAPYGVSVIVPSNPDEHPYDGIHDEGESLQFTRGRAVAVTAKAAEWLLGHPHYEFEKV